MQYLRGDIFFVRKAFAEGAEQDAGRPAVIVSNNIGNEHSGIVEVVYLTTQEKKPLPTHVEVLCKVPSTALCEQISSVSKDRLGDLIRTCTDGEMREIDKALMVSLGLTGFVSEAEYEAAEQIHKLKRELECAEKTICELTNVAEEKAPESSGNPNNELLAAAASEHSAVIAERNTYKAMYEQLLEKVMSQKGY